MNKFLIPQWPVSAKVKSYSTTRHGGVSLAPCDSLNLGIHVGDNADAVRRNRGILQAELAMPSAPVWMDQVHGVEVLYVNRNNSELQTADAAWTDQPGTVLSVMTADCLPVLIASRSGDVVAVAHGGWRGLADGIVQKTVAALPVEASELIAWLGPAIGPSQFEVGAEVKETFVTKDKQFSRCFTACADGKYLADIFKLGRTCLQAAGVTEVFGGGVCTYESQQFFRIGVIRAIPDEWPR